MNEVTVPPGYRQDAKGHLVPEHLVKPTDLLEDQLVEKLLGYADELSAQISRFKGHCFDDIAAFLDLLFQHYGVSRGGQKGNMTFSSYDGLNRVTVRIADHLAFGPELQAAKALIDECIAEWSADANAQIRVLVNHAFNVDKEGKVSVEAILALRRVAIEDGRWKRAMEAIGDSIRVVGSKAYIQFHRRAKPQDRWQAVTIALAAA